MLADQLWQEVFGGPETTSERLSGHLQSVLFNRYSKSPSRRIYQGSLGGCFGVTDCYFVVSVRFPFSLKFG